MITLTRLDLLTAAGVVCALWVAGVWTAWKLTQRAADRGYDEGWDACEADLAYGPGPGPMVPGENPGPPLGAHETGPGERDTAAWLDSLHDPGPVADSLGPATGPAWTPFDIGAELRAQDAETADYLEQMRATYALDRAERRYQEATAA